MKQSMFSVSFDSFRENPIDRTIENINQHENVFAFLIEMKI